MLNYLDLVACLSRLPKELKEAMTEPKFAGKVFIAGGFIRAVVTGEPVNDIDVFLSDKSLADELGIRLHRSCPESWNHDCSRARLHVYTTDNAYTLRAFNPVVQIIRNRAYKDAHDIVYSFDFSICAAVFYWHATKKQWASLTHGSFYRDLAAKRLTYLQPHKHDNASGSVLRVLKFYHMGYSIPVASLSAVMARLFKSQQVNGPTEYTIKKQLTEAFIGVDGRLELMEVGHMAAERLRNSGGSYGDDEDMEAGAEPPTAIIRKPRALLAEKCSV
jgi:hypothetical protein